jgi:hypothetical protein
MIGTNAEEVLGDAPAGAPVDDPAAAPVLPPAALAAAVVPCVVLAPADELVVLQPASRPIPTADAAASATFTLVLARPPPFTGTPTVAVQYRYPLLQAAGVP